MPYCAFVSFAYPALSHAYSEVLLGRLTPCTISNTQHVYSVNLPSLPIHSVSSTSVCYPRDFQFHQNDPGYLREAFNVRQRMAQATKRGETNRSGVPKLDRYTRCQRSGALVSISWVAWISNVAVDHIKGVKFPATGWISLTIARTAGR